MPGGVARLKLDDVDWSAGEIVVVGKGPRLERLPLPNDVGEAIVQYVREARPRVTAIVVRAGARAGLAPIGPHRLRHTAATEMLRTGASLPDIGQVLRHRRLQIPVLNFGDRRGRRFALGSKAESRSDSSQI